MLQAKTEDGSIVTLASLTKAEIASKRHERFFCPACHEQVIVRAGEAVIPHFAHRERSACVNHEGGEGPVHEKGKLLLYQWLRRQNLSVRLENYLPDINQRPDLLITIRNKHIALEFQCARIPIKRIMARNRGYHQLGMIPIWVLGADHFKRLHRHGLKVDPFLRRFIHHFPPKMAPVLFFFDPETRIFITCADLFLTKATRALGKFRMQKLDRLAFPDIFHTSLFQPEELYALWEKEKRHFRLNPNFAFPLYGQQRAWHEWLYAKHVYKDELPSIVYLPVSSQYMMMSPPWDWQSRLCLELLTPLPLGGTLTLAQCEKLLHDHMANRQTFPSFLSANNPIEEYLHLLEQLQIVMRRSPRHFVKINPIRFYNHIEEAVQADRRLMKQLRQLNRAKQKHDW